MEAGPWWTNLVRGRVHFGTSLAAVRAHHGELGVYDGAPCRAIEPTRMFAADMRVHQAADGTS